jgi:hypothetical protein
MKIITGHRKWQACGAIQLLLIYDQERRLVNGLYIYIYKLHQLALQ